jgi:large subunit ribosomal protein L10
VHDAKKSAAQPASLADRLAGAEGAKEIYMALSRDKKTQLVEEVSSLLDTSKMTVMAKYQGTSVKAMQDLRKQAKENGTSVKVVKNRLFKKALENSGTLKGVDASELQGQLIYAFNAEDEVAPAQSLKAFAKSNPQIEFVGAISGEGKFLSSDEVKALADLPGKNELIAQVVATLASPLNDVMNGLSGNLHALLDGIEAKASN